MINERIFQSPFFSLHRVGSTKFATEKKSHWYLDFYASEIEMDEEMKKKKNVADSRVMKSRARRCFTVAILIYSDTIYYYFCCRCQFSIDINT